jgi:hypothetical protein
MYRTNQLTGHTLTLRASGGDLSWDKGVLLAQSASNTWKWCATAGDIQVKVLLDDIEWGNGANTYIPAAGGTVYPFFLGTTRDSQYPQLWVADLSRCLIPYCISAHNFRKLCSIALRFSAKYREILFLYVCKLFTAVSDRLWPSLTVDRTERDELFTLPRCVGAMVTPSRFLRLLFQFFDVLFCN